MYSKTSSPLLNFNFSSTEHYEQDMLYWLRHPSMKVDSPAYAHQNNDEPTSGILYTE